MAKKWGADVMWDSDGTKLSPESVAAVSRVRRDAEGRLLNNEQDRRNKL